MIDVRATLVIFILLGIPYFFLLRKSGLSPYWTLLFLIAPMGFPLGAWLAFPILALRAWPSRNEIPNQYFFATTQNVLLVALHLLLPIFSLYAIFKKSGYSGWWCLSALVPPVGIIVLWVCALRKAAQPEAQETGN